MNQKARINTYVLAFVLICFGGSNASLRAQGRSDSQLSKAIHLKFTTNSGKTFRACVIEGGMVKVTDLNLGSTFNYYPTVIDQKSGTVSLKVYKVVDDNREVPEEVENLEVSFKSAKTTVNSPAYSIKIEAISTHVETPTSATNKSVIYKAISYNKSSQVSHECCVTCEGLTVCSNCTVTMSCQSCCTNKPNAPSCACGAES